MCSFKLIKYDLIYVFLFYNFICYLSYFIAWHGVDFGVFFDMYFQLLCFSCLHLSTKVTCTVHLFAFYSAKTSINIIKKKHTGTYFDMINRQANFLYLKEHIFIK